ncbi:hypothetical protein, partial [Flavobacterium psychrophilum]|uniref:hypothetical protein n=1 Tax=Flavobacterium psychrophilum TaxID=96345 RepID=UPI001ABCA3C6
SNRENYTEAERVSNSKLKHKSLVSAVVVRCYESALNFLEVFFAFSSKVSDSISEVFSQHFFASSSVKF